MRRTLLRSLAVVTALMVLGVTAVAAQGPGVQGLPGLGWWSGEQIANVGGGLATLNLTAYDSQSSDTYSVSRNLASGSSTTVLPDDFAGMPDGFQGSVIVSSDQPIRAMVNVTNLQAGSFGVAGGEAAAQYQGLLGEMVEPTVNFPLAKNDHFGKTTTFYIQNAGQNPTTVDAEFAMGTGTFTYSSPSISSGQMVAITPGDASVPAGNGNVGAASFTSPAGENLAGVVLEHPTSESPTTVLQATRGFSPADGDPTIYAPIIKKGWFGRHTGLQVQNVSGSSVDVTVNYSGIGGDCAGNTYSSTETGLQAGKSHTFFNDPNLPGNCLASATVTGTGNIAGVISETFFPGVPATGQRQTTYFAIPAHLSTTKLNAPLYKYDSFDKTTGLQVQNVGSSSTTVTCNFKVTSGGSGTFTGTTPMLGSGEAHTFLNPSFLPSGTISSVTCTASQLIVGIANESPFPFDESTKQQDKNNYEAFNLAP